VLGDGIPLVTSGLYEGFNHEWRLVCSPSGDSIVYHEFISGCQALWIFLKSGYLPYEGVEKIETPED
jgi:hypothetical protein